MPKLKTVLVTGVSGTGKSAVAEVLLEQKHQVIDVDSVPGLCFWVSRKTGKINPVGNLTDIKNDFINNHQYTIDKEMLKTMLSQMEGLVFVFGSVGDNSELTSLSNKVLLLQCESESLAHRLKTRSSNSFGKDPLVRQRMLEWKVLFDRMMIEAGAEVIDAEQPLEEVVADVLKHAQS